MDPISIVINWYKHRKERDGRTVVSQTYDQRTLSHWCRNHFDGVNVVFHQLRIERHLGIHQVMIRGKFILTEAVWQPSRSAGYYLFRGFKRHRQPR